ncbi:MAG: phospho-N-acetylmuramoyl-pentapeptide-transferase [Prevotella sp.]|nr:phospho-N-acetylmuramoyl-pentapeptide-transferase [Staphylococcus sp.]MCM1349631.1 phospho-N-acetylmuramoyl-pentapeptide-transferase [Prevotella sp.]
MFTSFYALIALSIIGILFGMALFQVMIPLLYRLKFGQSIREEGPVRHLSKKGTPTMGGLVILIQTLFLFITFLLINRQQLSYEYQIILLFLMVFIGFGVIGFWDDFLIVVKKNNHGLSAKLKFVLQLAISALAYILVIESRGGSWINFFGTPLKLSFAYGLFIVIGFAGCSNATNLTDGIDGLLGGTGIISFTGIMVLALHQQNSIVFFLAVSIVIALFSFLVFNLPKAHIFMGDTGSLAIGGILFAMLIALNQEVLIFFFGFVYFVETISVMLQVWFFKRTKGDRIFKMTPLHHHFELMGWKEASIDVFFWTIQAGMTILGIWLGVKLF